jgi:hypothetical protein
MAVKIFDRLTAKGVKKRKGKEKEGKRAKGK